MAGQDREILSIPFRRQASLSSANLVRERGQVKGHYEIIFAVVTSVDYQTGKITYSTDLSDDGTYSGTGGTDSNVARLPLWNFGHTVSGVIYGEAHYIHQGTLVAIGYISGDTSIPVVLNAYSNDDTNYSALSPTDLKMHDDMDTAYKDELLAQKIIYPSQQMQMITGNGNYYRTFGGRSFFTVQNDEMDKLNDLGYDGQGNTTNFFNNQTGEWYDVGEDAQNMLFLHQANSDTDTHRTRFFMHKDGRFELAVYDANDDTTLLALEMDKDNGLVIRQQTDTLKYEDSKQFTELTINNNAFSLVSNDDDIQGSIQVTPQGTSIDGKPMASDQALQNLNTSFQKVQKNFQAMQDAINAIGIDTIQKLPTQVASANRLAQEVSNTVSGQVTTDLQDLKDLTAGNKATNETQAKAITDLTSSLNDLTKSDNAKLTSADFTLYKAQTTKDIQEANANTASAKSELQKNIDSNVTATAKAQTTADSATSLAKNANDTVTTLASTVNTNQQDATSKYNTLQSSYTTLLNNYNDLTTKYNTVKGIADSATSGLATANANLATANANLATANKAITELTARVSALEKA